MKRLFDYIARKAKKRKGFEKSEEFRFFLENRHLLTKIPRFVHFYDADIDPFEVMRANIILQAYLNKTKMEEEVKSLSGYINTSNKKNHAQFVKSYHEIITELPYYQEGKDKIFIPFFTRSLNQIYNDEPEKLLTYPYDGLADNFKDTVIDPFDTYGSELYNSHYSRLVKVQQDGKETAFFHYDTNTIYFVNEQGRLDASVVLFDRYIRHPKYSHMLERIKPVIDAYFAFDREAFLRALREQGFMSLHMLHLIRFHDWAKL
ncbi:MAG: hypothetical protein J6T25_02345 [Bacilli bacterium]|nr:hypothetical protein [Bacilli bacterium]